MFVLNYLDHQDDRTYMNFFINIWMPPDPKYIWLKYFPMKVSILYKKVGLKYLRHWPLQWRHPTSSKRRGGISAGSPRNNKIHLNSLPMSYQFFEIDYDPWWLLRYLDQHGMASKYNTKVFCTQTLIGGNYGLLDTKTFLPILITTVLCYGIGSAMASAFLR
uniref:Uncharacterized protein n=1 Tax=Triticum urartu TaxID=4572 RepID=A0A8R7VGU3_TRIUA